MNIPEDYKDKLDEAAKLLADEGKLVEAGWLGYRASVIPPEASQIQVRETRQAFFAGATHLFFSLMHAMDPEEEPTDADEERMAKIHQELEAFAK
jgi:hypothetical protein